MSRIKIGIVGLHQSGKSLLINCLLKRNISRVGTGEATTHTPVYYYYSNDEYAEYFDTNGSHYITTDEVKEFDNKQTINKINVYLDCQVLKRFIIIDLPGTGYNSIDNLTMAKVLSEIDCAILLGTNVKEYTSSSSFYTNTFKMLQSYNIPYYFIFNCVKIEKWSPKNKQNINVAQSDIELLQEYPPLSFDENDDKPLVNLMWYWCSQKDDTDELYTLYYEDIKNSFQQRGIILSKENLESASQFSLINSIVCEDNYKILQLRRDYKRELNNIKSELCPIGTIQAFAYNSIPKGWMLCDGRKLDPMIHTELYDAIGTTFGGDGKSFFQIPDLRGCFVRGWDEFGKIDKDRTFGTFQEDSIHNHSHKVDSCSENGRHFHYIGYKHYPTQESNIAYTTYQHEHITDHGDSNKKGNRNTDHDGNHKHEIKIGSATKYGQTDCIISNETRPKNVALIFCIKINPLVNDGIIDNDDTNKKVNNTEVSQENEDSVSPTTEELNYNDIMSKLIKNE